MAFETDEENRTRLDDCELRTDVQEKVARLWREVTTENLADLSDIEGYRADLLTLFGFGYPRINHANKTGAVVGLAA